MNMRKILRKPATSIKHNYTRFDGSKSVWFKSKIWLIIFICRDINNRSSLSCFMQRIKLPSKRKRTNWEGHRAAYILQARIHYSKWNRIWWNDRHQFDKVSDFLLLKKPVNLIIQVYWFNQYLIFIKILLLNLKDLIFLCFLFFND